MKNETTRTTYNIVIGITEENEIYLLNSIFDDGKGFKGATGSVLVPVSQDYIDERNDIDSIIDNYGYLWTEAVASGTTTDSEEDYMQAVVDSSEGYFLGHDESDVHHIKDSFKDEHFPDAETFECIGGGRIFDRGMKFKTVLRQDLLDLIDAVELPKKPTLRAV